MNHHYNDIRGLTTDEPQWWDENAVPRYCPFTPDATADIYAIEAVLLLIACQDCGHEFRVCMTTGSIDVFLGRRSCSLADDITSDEIHYGDPPNAGCCPAGPTMNSIPRRVLEFWERPRIDWVRRPDLEREIACEWAA